MEILKTILLLAFPADIGSKSSSPARRSHNAYTPARVGFAGKPTHRLMMQPTVETWQRPYGAWQWESRERDNMAEVAIIFIILVTVVDCCRSLYGIFTMWIEKNDIQVFFKFTVFKQPPF